MQRLPRIVRCYRADELRIVIGLEVDGAAAEAVAGGADILEIALAPRGVAARLLGCPVDIPVGLMLAAGSPNIISLFKKGHAKVPIEKAPLLAKALGVDPADMLRRAMREYMPTTWQTIEHVLGDVATANERKILETIRSASKGSDPALDEDTD